MLVEFLSTLFFIFNILLIILVIMQKNHGGFWSGPAGTDSVNIFGGNQGADVLQKTTWLFGFILMIGCLFLSVYQAAQSQVSQFYLHEVKEHISSEQKTEESLENKENQEEQNSNDAIVEIEKKEEITPMAKSTPTHSKKEKENEKKSILSNTKKNK